MMIKVRVIISRSKAGLARRGIIRELSGMIKVF